jgi:hypothetical protein
MNLGLLKNTIDSVKRQLQEARDYKASLEVKALFPPADCSEPETYATELMPHIERAAVVIGSFEVDLARLERELKEEESAPVQLALMAF